MSIPSKKWYDYLPHPVVMLFGILVFAAILTHLLPAGVYERTLLPNGRASVVPDSYQLVPSSPVGFFGIFKALTAGFVTAAPIIFVVLTSGIMFGTMDRTGAIEHAVGNLIRQLGLKRKYLLVVILTYVFGLAGAVIGYENNIALIPIAAIVSLAIGGDLMLAAGFSVGAITVGFGLSPINPYTVGVGHQLANMDMFSGAGLRSLLCFTALGLTAWYNVRYFRKISTQPNRSLAQDIPTEGFQLRQELDSYQLSGLHFRVLAVFLGGIGTMLYGIFSYGWYFTEISAVFVLISITTAIVARMPGREFSETALGAISLVAPGAFMVGYATSIKEVLEVGQINDTISYQLSQMLTALPPTLSALGMSITQSLINLLIPSGSGQALATLPIMLPLGDVLGISRQVTILAFQIGDGVTNLFNPALGGLIAMLSMCRIPFDRWLRFIFPLVGLILILAWIVLVLAVLLNYQ